MGRRDGRTARPGANRYKPTQTDTTMHRFESITEALPGRRVGLWSELEPGRDYALNTVPFRFEGREDGKFVFVNGSGRLVQTPDQVEDLIAAGRLHYNSEGNLGPTLGRYHALDRMTHETTDRPAREVWDDRSITDRFGPTELAGLDELLAQHRVHEFPEPGTVQYDALLADRRWPVLKRYMQEVLPDIHLPEELG